MTGKVRTIAEQVKALPKKEFEEFLSWLADYELENSDQWDKELELDSQQGGQLDHVLQRVRRDIEAGKSRPLDEVLYNS